MIWVVLVVLVLVVVGAVLFVGRSGHQEPGVVKFQRHIDALSPKARRESFDRVRPQISSSDEER